MIKRFYKNTHYLGVKHQNKDTMGEWRREISLRTFYGRPYRRFEYDEIYEFTLALWDKFRALAIKQGEATNRQVIERLPDYLYLAPIWIHGVKQV